MPIELEWWGLEQPYRACLARQEALRAEVGAGRKKGVLALLEHRPVITTGKRAVQRLPDPHWLLEHDTELVATRRGGLATWHGPGQLTGYLICDLRPWGIRRTVNALEEGLMTWLDTQGVQAGRREGHPGVWHDAGKLAAIGLHVRHGISMHGFALNLQVVPKVWETIVPCGIEDAEPISLHQLIPGAPGVPEVWPSVGKAIQLALGSLDARSLPR